jgi:hypothetical protein
MTYFARPLALDDATALVPHSASHTTSCSLAQGQARAQVPGVANERFRIGLALAVGALLGLFLYAALQCAHVVWNWPAPGPLTLVTTIPFFWRVLAGAAGAAVAAVLCYSADARIVERLARLLPRLLMAAIFAITLVAAFLP